MAFFECLNHGSRDIKSSWVDRITSEQETSLPIVNCYRVVLVAGNRDDVQDSRPTKMQDSFIRPGWEVVSTDDGLNTGWYESCGDIRHGEVAHFSIAGNMIAVSVRMTDYEL